MTAGAPRCCPPGCGRPEPIYGDWSADFGFAAAEAVLADDPNDRGLRGQRPDRASDCCCALHEAGRRVPDDISVVGFDDQPETRYLIPPLTTVRQDFDAVGREAIALLVRAISGSPPQLPDLIPPELIVRASTGRAVPSDRLT